MHINDFFLLSLYIAVLFGVYFQKINFPERFLSKKEGVKKVQLLLGFLISFVLILGHKYGYERYVNELFYNLLLIPIALVIFVKSLGIVFDKVWDYCFTLRKIK